MIDINNLKLKYITGQYLNLNTIEPDDILFFMINKNKKQMKLEEVRKSVANSEQKDAEFDECIKKLIESNDVCVEDNILKIIS